MKKLINYSAKEKFQKRNKMNSFIYLFIYLFVYLFIYLFIQIFNEKSSMQGFFCLDREIHI